MRQILDFHIHSRYSRACSPSLTLANIEHACRIKGIDIIATGDFTYPAWFESIKNELVETDAKSGLYKLKIAPDDKIKFILSSEVALIYKDSDKVRRIHLVIHAPNIAAAEKLNKQLDKKYNIRSDGRPILGIKAPELVKMLLAIDEKFLVYPAHIWTPWFSVFGSKSGFDRLEDCFGDQTKYIYAYETGLSSDPEMNWRLSALDKLTLLSNSDAHSLNNIGREANIMEISEPITYQKIYDNIKDKKGMIATIEFYPEEGMYHLDGHRDCKFSCEPSESHKLKNLCPICKRPLVIGVLNRVEELADRVSGYRPKNAPAFKKLVELDKIIAEALNVKSRTAKAVQKKYSFWISRLGPELHILLDLDLDKINTEFDARVIDGIRRVRNGQLNIEPGFDGQYGKVKVFSASDKPNYQKPLL
ncbi:MAG: endonuclease Q family protein [Candidatus Falkowbacteria bacterium]